jgi:hypothetical protein
VTRERKGRETVARERGYGEKKAERGYYVPRLQRE